MTKSERFWLRLDPAERDMLADLAAHCGEAKAVVVRRLIREAWEAAFGGDQ